MTYNKTVILCIVYDIFQVYDFHDAYFHQDMINDPLSSTI